ncbi:MAG: primosomal protein N' [Chloroflexi bacterium RBG_16_60_22]|nr:MAG: primosomal protein N' [Chloroflexi bacterium RBG_16_60_22]
MEYAEVSVNSPVARRRTFSYAVPPGMTLHPGQAVLVPFGERVLQGIVIELAPVPAVPDTREIAGVIGAEPVLSSHHLALARWISDYYLAPLFDAVSLVLPPGFERKALAFLRAARPDADVSSLNDDQRHVLDVVGSQRVALRQVEKALGKRKAAAAVSALVRQGWLERSYELEPVRIKPRQELYISLTESAAELPKLSGKTAVLYEFLKEISRPVAWAEARKQTGVAKAAASALERRGLVTFSEVEVRREPISYDGIRPSSPLSLTTAQKSAFDAIRAGMQDGPGAPPVFLLHGVTGSGKTEVYLQALAEAVRRGKKGIVLVPEIALTPQTIERFAARFPRRVAVLHSRLSLGEQFDEWHRIRRGEFDVVIGSRSAIFAPQPDLGLVIIDEEHEWTYKQETSPHYHARDAAIRLAELAGAVVVLGSATPDVTTYYRAQQGDFNLLTLPERVVPAVGAALPAVEVVDMREELKAGNRSVFSRSLSGAINEAVAAREQVILFLNRRGGATTVQCRHCGFVLRCRRCEVPLAHHIAGDILTCHQCNYKTRVPQSCPNCASRQLRFLGMGTQKLEQEVKYTFPRARHLRWDSDVTAGRSAHEVILRKFRDREAEILIGTQMVAKGLDIPSVTLVGVVSADTSLNLPDFRAGERTFQLLSQVAGRAGRGKAGGRVVIQTFSPEHYAVRAAARHDYVAFYEEEIEYRRQLHNPPFVRLARLLYAHPNEAASRREAERMQEVLLGEINARGIGGISIIGPAPAFIQRLRGRFRWQLVLRGPEPTSFLAGIQFPQGWTVDIDPVSLI